MCSDKKPNWQDVKANLARPEPMGRKLRMILKNNLLKLVRLQSCCGHPGQPGC